jgi:hypothetical protein
MLVTSFVVSPSEIGEIESGVARLGDGSKEMTAGRAGDRTGDSREGDEVVRVEGRGVEGEGGCY